MKKSVQVVSPEPEILNTQSVTDGRILSAICNWRDLSDKKIQIVIQLYSTGCTLEKIGKTIGCSTEYARKLIHKIKSTHGAHVLKKTVLTIAETATKLRVREDQVRRICDDNKICCSPEKGRRHIITSEGFELLRTHPLITRKQICKICGKEFTLTGDHQGKQKTCSKKCKAVYNKKRREAKLQSTPSGESLARWHQILYERIQNREIPPNETWLTQTQAARHGRLTCSQVWWLRACKIVTIKLDHKIKWRQTEPLHLYAASEMKIAGQVFREYQRKQKKQHRK